VGSECQDNNSQQRFIHVCCKIISGRNLEQRNNLSETVLKNINTLAIKSVSISVEIVDMERESYNKRVS
jgi:5-carboxymethyl-2-hydroxymuconate isomerase